MKRVTVVLENHTHKKEVQIPGYSNQIPLDTILLFVDIAHTLASSGLMYLTSGYIPSDNPTFKCLPQSCH